MCIRDSVNTAAPSRKKLLSLVLTLVFMLTCLPAALAVDLNVDAGLSLIHILYSQDIVGYCNVKVPLL